MDRDGKRREGRSVKTLQDICISVAVLDELESILALQKIAFMSEAALIDDYSIPPLKQDITEIRDEFRHTHFLKAEIDNQIVGSVRAEVHEGTCLIKKLIVHPDYQNRGIGSLLLKSIEQSFPLIKRFELFTGRESRRNDVFYKRRGYKPFTEKIINEKLTLVGYEKMNFPV
jgi:N-acetylglutamate synthase-like GNAT family acetyltransferase